MLTTLGGCASAPKDKIPVIQFTGKPLPVMPDRYARVIPDPGVTEGRDARVELARNRAWGKSLRDQHAAYVTWYRRVRAASLK